MGDETRIEGDDLTRVFFMAAAMLRRPLGEPVDWSALQPALGEAASAYLALKEAAALTGVPVRLPGREDAEWTLRVYRRDLVLVSPKDR